jgi:hypothetical protein
MINAPVFGTLWVRVTLLATALILMFGLFTSVPLRPNEELRNRYKPSATAKIDPEQRKSEEKILIAMTNNAVSEIRLRLEAEDRWFNYNFVLVGGLLGAFLARFTIGGKSKRDAETQLKDMTHSTPLCCALAFATIVTLIIDIHVRNNTIVIAQLGSWLAYFAEPALAHIAFGGERNGFLTWEDFFAD